MIPDIVRYQLRNSLRNIHLEQRVMPCKSQRRWQTEGRFEAHVDTFRNRRTSTRSFLWTTEERGRAINEQVVGGDLRYYRTVTDSWPSTGFPIAQKTDCEKEPSCSLEDARIGRPPRYRCRNRWLCPR
jgi:hypothetical protein